MSNIVETMARAYCADFGSDPDEWHESHHKPIRAALRSVKPEDISEKMAQVFFDVFDGAGIPDNATSIDAAKIAISAAIAAGA